MWNETQKLLRRYKVNYTAYATRYRGHATRLAEKISTMEGKAQVYLIVVGGDGTINEVLNGIRDFGRVRLGVIPTGSGNDFCRNLKLPGTPEESLRTDPGVHPQGPPGQRTSADRSGTGYLGEGCKKPRIFGISAGVGLDALVCKKALDSRLKRVLNRLHLGKLTYLALDCAVIIYYGNCQREGDHRARRLHPSEDDLRSIHEPSGRGRRCPHGTGGIPEGWTFIFKQCIGNRQMADIFPSSIAGCSKQEGIKGFNIRDEKNFRMVLDKPMVLHADGEYCGDVKRAEFCCLEKKLQLLHKDNMIK